MATEYDKGFKIQQVDLFLMGSMKKVCSAIAVFHTNNGLVVRRNDIPVAFGDQNKDQKILVGGLQETMGSDILYELPCFQDNVEFGETAFTVMSKSDLTRKHVLTLFEKL